MAGGSIRGVEYVVTDDARNLIAAVRPMALWRPRRIPRWAEDKDVVVVGPDGASGLAVRAGRRGRWRIRETWVLVKGSALIGMVAPGRRTWTFRDCTCGQPHDRCQCGGRQGKVLPCSVTEPAWTVVDAADHELARITRQGFVIDIGPEDMRARLGRWGREAHTLWMAEKIRSFDVVDAGPGFDWHRHGLLVALAVLIHEQLTRQGGGA